jgi:hypothetical protein
LHHSWLILIPAKVWHLAHLIPLRLVINMEIILFMLRRAVIWLFQSKALTRWNFLRWRLFDLFFGFVDITIKVSLLKWGCLIIIFLRVTFVIRINICLIITFKFFIWIFLYNGQVNFILFLLNFLPWKLSYRFLVDFRWIKSYWSFCC